MALVSIYLITIPKNKGKQKLIETKKLTATYISVKLDTGYPLTRSPDCIEGSGVQLIEAMCL